MDTVVQYLAERDGSSCDCCKSFNTSYSHGIWAHKMGVQDYQGLIDRGWRRSGCYCYKPTMDTTCCPSYTIRCAALKFNLSKSHKKAIKRFNRYVVADNSKASAKSSQYSIPSENTEFNRVEESAAIDQWPKQTNEKNYSSAALDSSVLETVARDHPAGGDGKCDYSTSTSKKGTIIWTTEHPNPTASQQKKAKPARKEHKQIKLHNESRSEDGVNAKLKPNTHQGKSLEEFLNEVLTPASVHKLEIRMVRSSPPSKYLEQTFQESYEVYRKYQTKVHGESPDNCSFHQYKRFLINSPLQPWKPQHGPSDGYGSFHQQYWLDEKLIAVGVIDILPKSVSSVYFYYDPDLAFLSLGTYSALTEIAMVRSLSQQIPSIEFYYMGYYIHNYTKLLYKASYKPSYLLCPEVYTWHPFEECKQKLDHEKYCRLNPDATAIDAEGNMDIDEVVVLYKSVVTTYGHYKSVCEHDLKHNDEKVLQYTKLVGEQRSKSMMLFITGDKI